MPTEELTASPEAARFHTMIAHHPDLRVVGVDAQTQTVRFHNMRAGTTTEIPRLPEQLETAGAADILAILEGKRDPKVLEHITRIVGYFSRTKDWNRSKLAELADRRKQPHRVPIGDYRLGGTSAGN